LDLRNLLVAYPLPSSSGSIVFVAPDWGSIYVYVSDVMGCGTDEGNERGKKTHLERDLAAAGEEEEEGNLEGTAKGKARREVELLCLLLKAAWPERFHLVVGWRGSDASSISFLYYYCGEMMVMCFHGVYSFAFFVHPLDEGSLSCHPRLGMATSEPGGTWAGGGRVPRQDEEHLLGGWSPGTTGPCSRHCPCHRLQHQQAADDAC
jgi:hypothetical protein